MERIKESLTSAQCPWTVEILAARILFVRRT
jgi:hypothetical protein